MKRLGTLIVLSGPSGAGKSTLIGQVKAKLPELEFSVSCTTRAPRPGETDHVNYHFISQEEFDARVAADEFVEHAGVHGHSYGTLKSEVFRRLEAGHDVLLDIDVQGAMLIQASAGRDPRLKRCAVFVFLAPPSLKELERRLRGRGTESEEQIRIRLGAAAREISCWRKYDYLVVNDSVERAAAELETLFRSFELRTAAIEGDFDDEK